MKGLKKTAPKGADRQADRRTWWLMWPSGANSVKSTDLNIFVVMGTRNLIIVGCKNILCSSYWDCLSYMLTNCLSHLGPFLWKNLWETKQLFQCFRRKGANYILPLENQIENENQWSFSLNIFHISFTLDTCIVLIVHIGIFVKIKDSDWDILKKVQHILDTFRIIKIFFLWKYLLVLLCTEYMCIQCKYLVQAYKIFSFLKSYIFMLSLQWTENRCFLSVYTC